MGRNIVFSVMKNEAPFLLEWVAYYRVLGFDELLIYSNNSDDGTHEFLDALQAAGAVSHVRCDNPPDIPAQTFSVDHVLQSGRFQTGDYLAFLDSDEFLNIKIGNRKIGALRDFIGDAQGMSVAWRRFGDSGNLRFTGRLISADYPMAEPRNNTADPMCKTYYRIGPGFERCRVHKPRFSDAFWDSGVPFLGADGKPIDAGPEGRDHPYWRDPAREAWVPRARTDFDIAQVNHYQLRSIAGFALKARRGNGASFTKKGTTKYDFEHLAGHNPNREEDRSALFYAPELEAEIERLLGDTAVRTCHTEATSQYRAFEQEYLRELRLSGALKQIGYALVPPEAEAKVAAEKPRPARDPNRRLERRPRLILHIGQMKTGTTTLQFRMARSRKALEADGVFYPQSTLNFDAHHEMAIHLDQPDHQDTYVDRIAGGRAAALSAADALLGQTRDWLDRHKDGTVVLSTELITSWPNEGLAGPIRTMAEDLVGDDYRVVAYVRSPLGGVLSRGQQALYDKTLLPIPVGQMMLPLLRSLDDGLGEAFHVTGFQRDLLEGGDIVADFFARFLPGVPVAKDGQHMGDLNKSLSPEAMALMQDAKLTVDPSGEPFATPETRHLFNRIREHDLRLAGYASPKLKRSLIAPLTALQTEALELRDRFGIEFPDLDYDLIGKPTDFDLARLHMVREVTDVDEDRYAALRALLLEEAELVANSIGLVRRLSGHDG